MGLCVGIQPACPEGNEYQKEGAGWQCSLPLKSTSESFDSTVNKENAPNRNEVPAHTPLLFGPPAAVLRSAWSWVAQHERFFDQPPKPEEWFPRNRPCQSRKTKWETGAPLAAPEHAARNTSPEQNKEAEVRKLGQESCFLVSLSCPTLRRNSYYQLHRLCKFGAEPSVILNDTSMAANH